MLSKKTVLFLDFLCKSGLADGTMWIQQICGMIGKNSEEGKEKI